MQTSPSEGEHKDCDPEVLRLYSGTSYLYNHPQSSCQPQHHQRLLRGYLYNHPQSSSAFSSASRFRRPSDTALGLSSLGRGSWTGKLFLGFRGGEKRLLTDGSWVQFQEQTPLTPMGGSLPRDPLKFQGDLVITIHANPCMRYLTILDYIRVA